MPPQSARYRHKTNGVPFDKVVASSHSGFITFWGATMGKKWRRLPAVLAERVKPLGVGVLIAATGVLTWALPGETSITWPYRVIVAGLAGLLVGAVSWHLTQRKLTPEPGSLARGRGISTSRNRQDAERYYVVPWELPPAPAVFVGRDDQIRVLREKLDAHEGDAPFVAVLNGRGGIGKTALALSFAHQIADRFPDGQIFIRVAQWDSMPAANNDYTYAENTDIITRIAHEIVYALRSPGQNIPEQRQELIELFGKLSQGRHLIIILDDVPEHTDLSPLLLMLTRSSIIITARKGPAEANADIGLELEPLSDTDALTLLQSAIGVDRVREGEGARDLVDWCNGDPLALALAGAALAARPHWKLSLARDLISQDDSPPNQSGAKAREAEPLEATYLLLTKDEQHAIRCIGTIGTARFAPWALQAALGDPEETEASALASRLTRARLIERTSEGIGSVPLYQVAEPIVAYARRLADRADTQGAMRRLDARRAERRQERPSQRIRQQVYPLMRAGRLSEAIERARDTLTLTKENPDRGAEAVCFAALAELYTELGELSAAEDAAEYAISIGEADSKARAHRSMAKLQRRANHLLEAERHLNDALHLAIQADDPGEQIRVLAERAMVLGRLGDFDRALADSLKSYEMCKFGEKRQLPFALLSYGAVHLYMGDSGETSEQSGDSPLDKAEKIFAEGYREAENEQEGSKQFLMLSWIRHAQARVAIEKGELRKASDWATEAMALFSERRHRYGAAHCRLLLGAINLPRNPSEAADQLLAALETFHNCGDARIEADVSLELAQAYLRLGKRKEARPLQQAAVSNYLELGDRRAARTATVAVAKTQGARFRRRPEQDGRILAATHS
jgi:tetratricopeptide (TPR) repeat protein